MGPTDKGGSDQGDKEHRSAPLITATTNEAAGYNGWRQANKPR
ncbi:hypothetical protein KR52_07655 [Synechococcus sp. KORDI-52]|nr:hypothetical protein [Synechococcus sp. KORDI-52]AII49015.1 hypothetical protein KR52_07655 [Synechococcus sp. KORDI-52]